MCVANYASEYMSSCNLYKRDSSSDQTISVNWYVVLAGAVGLVVLAKVAGLVVLAGVEG